MPIKVGNGSSYEILDNDRYSYDAKPERLIDADSLSLNRKSSKDRNWERRLLDLSLKNNLLNFRYTRDCVHLLITDLKTFFEKTDGVNSITLLANQGKIDDALFFGLGSKVKTLSELVSIELNSHIVRSYCGESGLQEAVQALIRKGKASREEVGANTIFLAFGFLKWKNTDDKDFKYAPIVLMPVNVKRTKTQGVLVELSDEYVVNTTLLEFLKQSFGIDIRGVEDEKLSPVEMLAIVRAKTAEMKGWLVYDDVYLAQYTFAGYAMWRDVRDNMGDYKRNPLIAGLLENANKFTGNKLSGTDEDDADPTDVLIPLACDSSQYAAVAESERGTTFVLHGPPGTGKSQTITNIIQRVG